MTAILTPALALRYLGELSTDLRAAVVLGPDGALLAGEAALASPAAALLATTSPGARELAVPLSDEQGARHGTALVARSADDAPALVVLAGPLALLDLLRHDLGTAADGLAGLALDALDAHAGAPPAPSDAARRPPATGASSRVQAPEGEEIAVPAAISAGMALLRAAGAPGASVEH